MVSLWDLQETTAAHYAFTGYMCNCIVCSDCGASSKRFESTSTLTLQVSPRFTPAGDKWEEKGAQNPKSLTSWVKPRRLALNPRRR